MTDGRAHARYSCARASAGACESLHGTASLERRWLLLEQPGPWGADAVHASDLDPAVAAALAVRAGEVGARLLLIRRTGGGLVGAGRRAYVAFSGPSSAATEPPATAGGGRSQDDAEGPFLEQLGLRHPADLLDFDLEPLRRGRPVGGRRLRRPLYLVCTHGKHDPCCAEFGLPLARALADDLDGRVWECSHIGGDRFAGNLVCLPEGIYYGRVTPTTAAAVVAAHETGRIDLDHYRGRSSQPFVAQAADALVRAELGLMGLDDLRLIAYHDRGAAYEVAFAGPGGRPIIAVVSVAHRDPARLTCHAGTPEPAPSYRLERLEAAVG